ncbi:MAG: outer membrane protein assembly factor BamD, partial [Gemmatimonadales bacterium]
MQTVLKAASILLVAALCPNPAAARPGQGPAPAPSPDLPPLSMQAGPDDSLYRRAREALNRDEYARAAQVFSTLRTRYPRSEYAPDAYYWEAYARYRIGDLSSLRTALDLLERQARLRPSSSASTRSSGDAAALENRVLGELARQGDAAAARRLTVVASGAVAPTPPTATTPPVPAIAPTPPVPGGRGVGQRADTRCRDEDDLQISALNSVMQMESERAIPIL